MIRTDEGMLIDFEGIDGSGKTTQAEMAHAHLLHQGIPVRLLREPTHGRYGKTIRDILSGCLPRRTPEEELDLFVKDRQEDVSENILPALSAGEVVLIDRYYYSTMAYQGAQGLDVEDIRSRNEAFAPKPDLVLIFLVSVEKGLARIKAVRENGTDHYEKEAFLKKVDAIFRSFRGPEIRFIDAEGPLLEVHGEVAQIIEKLIDKRRT